jgi:nicotinamide mononucleotide (NMN) deamidase PncC
VSVTGIAGPDGGSPSKPVGLTYVAVADGTGAVVRRFAWTGDRAENKRRSAGAALGLLLERLDAHGDADDAASDPTPTESVSAPDRS